MFLFGKSDKKKTENGDIEKAIEKVLDNKREIEKCEKETKTITVKTELDLWNSSQEALLTKWGEECKALEWKHKEAYKKYRKKDKYYTITSIVLATVAGVGSFVNIECDSWFSFGIGLTASASAGFITLNKQLKLEETASKHKESYSQFSKLKKEVSYILSFDRKNRGDSSAVITSFKDNYEKAISESLDIPNDIVRKYEEKNDLIG